MNMLTSTICNSTGSNAAVWTLQETCLSPKRHRQEVRLLFYTEGHRWWIRSYLDKSCVEWIRRLQAWGLFWGNLALLLPPLLCFFPTACHMWWDWEVKCQMRIKNSRWKYVMLSHACIPISPLPATQVSPPSWLAWLTAWIHRSQFISFSSLFFSC